MTEELHPMTRLLRDDRRYKFEAYQFVREGLDFAQEVMKFGAEEETEDPAEEPKKSRSRKKSARHVTGQQLCHALKQYAVKQYGLMAKLVLNSWGLKRTGDFGEIVYNLISIGAMSKSKRDRKEDFENVFDFDQAFIKEFVITAEEPKR